MRNTPGTLVTGQWQQWNKTSFPVQFLCRERDWQKTMGAYSGPRWAVCLGLGDFIGPSTLETVTRPLQKCEGMKQLVEKGNSKRSSRLSGSRGRNQAVCWWSCGQKLQKAVGLSWGKMKEIQTGEGRGRLGLTRWWHQEACKRPACWHSFFSSYFPSLHIKHSSSLLHAHFQCKESKKTTWKLPEERPHCLCKSKQRAEWNGKALRSLLPGRH